MATVPTPAPVTDGVVAPGATLNTGLVTIPTFLLAVPMVLAFATAGVSTANNTLSGPVPLAGESVDNDAMHDPVTNNSRIVFNTLGWFEVKAWISWGANAVGYRYMALRDTGGSIIASHITAGITPAGLTGAPPQTNLLSIDYQVTGVGTQYLEMMIQHTAGGALTYGSGASAPYLTGISARWIHN